MQHYCSLPWDNLDIDPQGNFRPCCKYKHSLADNLVDYRNSPELKDLKDQFLQGQRPSGCNRCWQDEDSGLVSKRMLESSATSSTSQAFTKLQLAFGNTCNLACRTCYSYASSKWADNERKVKNILPDITIYKHQKFYNNPEFTESLRDSLTNLSSIEISGGEPFLSGTTQQLEWLDFLIDNNTSGDINLTHITNGTVFPTDEFWARWEKFKTVTLLVSIDGLKEKFEYIRWPAQWQDCLININRYKDKSKLYSNIILKISHTVSIFNVLDLPEFFIWCYKQGLDDPYLGMVSDPDYFSIKNLPEPAKEYISKKLGKTNRFQNVINFMNLPGTDLSQQAWHYIKTYDDIRDQSFDKIFPYIANQLT